LTQSNTPKSRDQTFLIVAGAITAVLLPTIVFLPTLLQKLAAFIGIIAVAAGIAALVVKLRRK